MHTLPASLALSAILLAGGCSASSQADPGAHAGGAHVTVTVDGQGFHPASVTARAGAPLTLTFRRTTDQTCATEVVFPAQNIRKPLPLDQAVDVELTPAAGTIAFACGMDMLRGTVVAR